MALPPAVADLAEQQLGVIARRQLTAHVGRNRADGLIRGPWCEPMALGVHRIVGGARLPEQVAIAAALRAGPGAILTGPVVLHLLDVDGFRGDDPCTVLLPPGRRLQGVDFPCRPDPDPDRGVGMRGEVRVAGPVDALIDSAELLGRREARRLRLAHDVLRWRGLLTPGRLRERVAQLGGQTPGASLLDELLELDAEVATGTGERTLGQLLGRFDPPPEPQVWVTPRRRVDWYFRRVRYGYEYQGSVDHATTAGRSADDARDRELRREGIRLGYVTAGDLDDEVAVLATVAGTLAARAHELGVDPPVLRTR